MALVTNLSVPNYLHNRRYASAYEAQAPSAVKPGALGTLHPGPPALLLLLALFEFGLRRQGQRLVATLQAAGRHGMASREQVTIGAAGFWAAVVALAGAIGYILSVPLQVMSILSPTQDSVVAFVSSLAIAPAFLVAVTALHYTVPQEKRFWTHVAVQLGTIYATLACVNYVVQLATVLPAGYSWTFTDQAGTSGPLSVLNQTPHSLMWDVDGLAYIFLNLSTLFAAKAFERNGPQRVMRRVFLANASITPLFAIAYFWPHFSVPVLLLGGIPWSITVPASMLALSIYFRRLTWDDPRSSVAGHAGGENRSKRLSETVRL